VRDDVSNALRRLRAFGPLSMVHFHDFSAVAGSPPPRLAGRQLQLVTQAERCVNIDTFVFDLHLSLDTLWQRLQSNARRNIKKAESLGTTVRFTRAPAADVVDTFFEVYARMARPKGLRIPLQRFCVRPGALDGMTQLRAIGSEHLRRTDSRTSSRPVVADHVGAARDAIGSVVARTREAFFSSMRLSAHVRSP